MFPNLRLGIHSSLESRHMICFLKEKYKENGDRFRHCLRRIFCAAMSRVSPQSPVPLSCLTSRKNEEDQKQMKINRIKVLKFFCFATGCHSNSTYFAAGRDFSLEENRWNQRKWPKLFRCLLLLFLLPVLKCNLPEDLEQFKVIHIGLRRRGRIAHLDNIHAVLLGSSLVGNLVNRKKRKEKGTSNDSFHVVGLCMCRPFVCLQLC